MARGTMKLVDPYTGGMECWVCGSTHWANLRRGGFYVRGSWQCMEKDSHPDPATLSAHERAELLEHRRTLGSR